MQSIFITYRKQRVFHLKYSLFFYLHSTQQEQNQIRASFTRMQVTVHQALLLILNIRL